MREVAAEVEIRADAGEVWHTLTDFQRYQCWNPSVSTISGDLARGSVLKITGRGARHGVTRAKVTEVNPKRMLAWRSDSSVPGILETEYIFQIGPAGEGRCRFSCRVQFRGLLVPFLAPDLDPDLIDDIGHVVRALRHEVEHFEPVPSIRSQRRPVGPLAPASPRVKAGGIS